MSSDESYAGLVPLPRLVAAWFVLERAPLERMPWWAAEWLVRGYGSETLQELAGLDGRDPRAVRDLLPEALSEAGVALPTAVGAAATEVFHDLAERCLSGRVGERWVAQIVEEIVVNTDFDEEVSTCLWVGCTALTMRGKAAGAPQWMS